MLPWLPGFPPQAFPTTVSSFTSPRLSLRSQQQPSPWDCATIPKLQLSATVPSRGLRPCPGYVWLQQGLLILIPFGRPQVSCFTFSLKRFSSDSDSCPSVGIGPLPQLPHPPRAGPVLLTLLFLPPIPSSYLVLPGSVNSFLVRSSCPLSACPPRTSESEGVFLTYPWREVCSLSSSSRHLVPLSVICSLLLWLPLKDN